MKKGGKRGMREAIQGQLKIRAMCGGEQDDFAICVYQLAPCQS